MSLQYKKSTCICEII